MNTYTIAFALHPNLLEGYFILCVDMNTLEDLTVGTRANDRLVAGLSVVDRL